jgi:hypothetical protein
VGVNQVALTKEQRSELLFLVVEKLQTRPDYQPSNLEKRLTSEQRENLPRLVDRIEGHRKAGELSFTATAGPAREESLVR